MVSILRNVKILSFDKYMKLKKNKKQKHKQKVSECINWQVEGLEMGIQTFQSSVKIHFMNEARAHFKN